jgi:hypothetical protein
MLPSPPAALQLAQRLRHLRTQWADARLTQEKLAAAFSAEEKLAAATVSSWESNTAPKLPPAYRLRAYARFFATPRSIKQAAPVLLPLAELTDEEHEVYAALEKELLWLRTSAAGTRAEEEIAFSKSWLFSDAGRVTVVCAELPDREKGPLTVPSNPNYTELQRYADLDALMELFGHLRAENPLTEVRFKIPDEVEADDLTDHVVLIGGMVWHAISGRLSALANLPIRQYANPRLGTGEIFVAKVEGQQKEFWPKWADTEGKILAEDEWVDKKDRVLAEDVGMLARVANPLNSSRTLTICSGIHTRGVYGAVRSLTDARLRDANERFIATNFGPGESFAMLMSVPVFTSKGMTPDFNGDGTVLFQWVPDTAA